MNPPAESSAAALKRLCRPLSEHRQTYASFRSESGWSPLPALLYKGVHLRKKQPLHQSGSAALPIREGSVQIVSSSRSGLDLALDALTVLRAQRAGWQNNLATVEVLAASKERVLVFNRIEPPGAAAWLIAAREVFVVCQVLVELDRPSPQVEVLGCGVPRGDVIALARNGLVSPAYLKARPKWTVDVPHVQIRYVVRLLRTSHRGAIEVTYQAQVDPGLAFKLPERVVDWAEGEALPGLLHGLREQVERVPWRGPQGYLNERRQLLDMWSAEFEAAQHLDEPTFLGGAQVPSM